MTNVTPTERDIFNAIHDAKAELMRTADPERRAALRVRIGELTQQVRRLRMGRDNT